MIGDSLGMGVQEIWVLYHMNISLIHILATPFWIISNHFLHASSKTCIPENYNGLSICLTWYTVSFQSIYWSINCCIPIVSSQCLLTVDILRLLDEWWWLQINSFVSDVMPKNAYKFLS